MTIKYIPNKRVSMNSINLLLYLHIMVFTFKSTIRGFCLKKKKCPKPEINLSIVVTNNYTIL